MRGTDDFEAAVFLTESSARHSVMVKTREFKDAGAEGLRSNSSRMLGAEDGEEPEEVGLHDVPTLDDASGVVELSEDDDDQVAQPVQAPDAQLAISDTDTPDNNGDARRSKRPRATTRPGTTSPHEPRAAKRPRGADDEKKMAADTTYEGFAIYGWALCVVVKRRDGRARDAGAGRRGAMMEDWIASTQGAAAEEEGG
jgi:hypothetical protein